MSGTESSHESASDDGRIILTIHGKQYVCSFLPLRSFLQLICSPTPKDVTDYAPVHPGEGHNDIYLEDYAGQAKMRVHLQAPWPNVSSLSAGRD